MKNKLIIASMIVGVIQGYPAMAADSTSSYQLDKAPSFSLSVTRMNDAEFDEDSIDDVEFSVSEVELKGDIVDFDVGAGKIVVVGDFRYSQYQYNTDQIDDKDLYEVAVPMTYTTGPATWMHRVTIIPGINSDFENISGDDVKFSAFYQAIYRRSSTLTWVMGLGAGHQFGDTQAFPIFGAIYKPNEKWHFNLVFPEFEASYIASAKSHWYLSVKPTGRTWNIEVESSNDNVDITTKEIRVALGTVYAVNQSLALRVEVGSAMNRELDLTLDNGSEVELDVEDATFIGLSLEYRH